MMRRRHQPIPEQGRWLASVLRGHANYYGVPGNQRGAVRLPLLRPASTGIVALRRRSQRTTADLGADAAPARSMATVSRRSSIPGQTPASTLVPKGGAQCVSSARWDLCGGRSSNGRPYRDSARNGSSWSGTVELTLTKGSTEMANCAGVRWRRRSMTAWSATTGARSCWQRRSQTTKHC